MILLLFEQYLDSLCSLLVKAKAFGGGDQVAGLHCVDGDPVFDALMVMCALKILFLQVNLLLLDALIDEF